MTTVPLNYTEAEAGLRSVGDSVMEVQESVRTAIARIQAAGARMAQLGLAAPVGYLGLIQFIDQQAAANPSDAVWQNLKARRVKIVGDFTTVQTYITGLTTAISSV